VRPIIRATGSWAGRTCSRSVGWRGWRPAGLKQNVMNVDDVLLACSVDHPRGDHLIHSAPVQIVRLQGPFVERPRCSAPCLAWI
jgi:hypothetical protein